MKKVIMLIMIVMTVCCCDNTKHYYADAEGRSRVHEAADTIVAHMKGWAVVDSAVYQFVYSNKEDRDGNRKSFYKWVATVRVTDGEDTLRVIAIDDQIAYCDETARFEEAWRGNVEGKFYSTRGNLANDIKRQNLAMRRACEGDSCFSLKENDMVLKAEFMLFKPREEVLSRQAYGLE